MCPEAIGRRYCAGLKAWLIARKSWERTHVKWIEAGINESRNSPAAAGISKPDSGRAMYANCEEDTAIHIWNLLRRAWGLAD